MRQKIIFVTLFFLVGFLTCPSLVLAGYDYYVDVDADSGGDGSEKKPFDKIKDALDEGGKEIYIKGGVYNESVTLGKSIKLKGEDKRSVVIKGKVQMGDGSSIENLTVKSGGVVVSSGDSVSIEKVAIIDSGTGIETSGNGKLRVINSEISGNGKGMYIQKDKDIEIRSSVVTNNSEEGIDIRQNVDGIISGNTIKNNGESGIEVIAGGSELKISGNVLQSNGASGIAVQYYTMANKNGALRVYNNTISSNKNYGVTCKNPSGGSPGGSYWTESVDMGSNKISNNKDGDFSSFCKFSNDVVNAATKTEEQLEQERLEQEKAEQEALQKQKEEEEKLKLEQEEKIKQEEEQIQEQKQEQERLEQERRERIKKDLERQKKIEDIYLNFIEQNETNKSLKQEIEGQSKFKTFFIGVDYKKLSQLSEQVLSYDEKVSEIEELKQQINSKEVVVKEQITIKINEIQNQKVTFKDFVSEEINKFSLFGWVFG